MLLEMVNMHKESGASLHSPASCAGLGPCTSSGQRTMSHRGASLPGLAGAEANRVWLPGLSLALAPLSEGCGYFVFVISSYSGLGVVVGNLHV